MPPLALREEADESLRVLGVDSRLLEALRELRVYGLRVTRVRLDSTRRGDVAADERFGPAIETLTVGACHRRLQLVVSHPLFGTGLRMTQRHALVIGMEHLVDTSAVPMQVDVFALVRPLDRRLIGVDVPEDLGALAAVLLGPEPARGHLALVGGLDERPEGSAGRHERLGGRGVQHAIHRLLEALPGTGRVCDAPPELVDRHDCVAAVEARLRVLSPIAGERVLDRREPEHHLLLVVLAGLGDPLVHHHDYIRLEVVAHVDIEAVAVLAASAHDAAGASNMRADLAVVGPHRDLPRSAVEVDAFAGVALALLDVDRDALKDQ
ncbi:MAG TPA: hypothetical protein PK095_00530 [Myxococcota bacterium]|nr:hypothetical protein [Myxococcota bacterium]